MPRGNLWGLVVVIVLAAVLLPAASLGFADSAIDQDVEDEQLTLEYQVPVPVDAADHAISFDEEIQVVDPSAGGDELVDGTDYEWNDSSGEVTAINEEYNQTDVDVSYTYFAQTEETRAIAQIARPVGTLLGYLPLIVGVFAAMGLVAGAFKLAGSGGFGGR